MKILFLCPHGAVKSVIAAAYAAQLAEERGLLVEVGNAGTEPDPAIPAKVTDLLATHGLNVSDWQPKLVSTEMLERADRVISLGCDLEALRVPADKAHTWIVPAPSEDLIACHDAIKTRVKQLIAELTEQT